MAAINRRRRRLNPRSRVEKQRASIRRAAQGLGRESSQRFWTFGPERVLGPGQERQRSARAAAGSEDPRKIDSAWHIPPGWKKRELGLSQLTRVMYAVGKKMGAGEHETIQVPNCFGLSIKRAFHHLRCLVPRIAERHRASSGDLLIQFEIAQNYIHLKVQRNPSLRSHLERFFCNKMLHQ